jgi:hypothetical protein
MLTVTILAAAPSPALPTLAVTSFAVFSTGSGSRLLLLRLLV